MHPKTMRQQNGNHEATSARKPSSSQRAQTRASTEYQERYLPPRCHTAVISSSRPKDPYHPLKGTSAEMTTFRSFYVTHKWMKQGPKAPQPSLPPKVPPRCSTAPHNPVRFVANQMASKVEDYTTVYQNDFQEWKANKRQPYKLADCLRVNQGLVVTNSSSKEGRSQKNSVQVADNSKLVPQVQEPKPIESVTSYRSDYVTHPVQPRMRREKPVYQSKGLPLEPAAPLKPKVAWDINQDFFDEASELFQQFKTWSLENKVNDQAEAKESSPLADNDFLSTTHAHYTAHKCQRTKPILPSMQTREKSKEPFQTTTTMKEDFKAWDTPRRLPSVRKELDKSKKTTFSLGTPKPAESCKTNLKPFSLHPKLNEAAVCSSTCNATKKPQCPAENGAFSGLECIDPGTKEYRMYWNTSLDRGVTWADGGVCEEPPQAHQIISCMVSKLS